MSARTESAAKAQYEAVTGQPWEYAPKRSAKLCRQDAAAIAKAIDAYDAASGGKAAESERKLLRTYYRSLTPDRELWCESSDPLEVREMSEGKDCAFEVIRFYETTDGWQEWA